ncbi:hypothetical protein WOLCODRAFT_147085 [Wolfiporia cocos MD-104 SS10]|uniref:Uncharacterized protein n=1 Tax=Wolfiporia cocos (strain MD-104) TaxID=742152 RepID=A0A2H3JAL1_WOLCO|nr:hypothetical protein WOLCODRAFT_147085 [Wolfiporia cocos MD-104 SS10]
MFPSLHTLELHYPTKNSTGAHQMFYMSELCALLSRAPNLSDVSLNVAVPLVDVHVHESPTILDAHSTSSPYHSRRSPHVVKTLVLPRLHRLDWNLAPPKDAWLLFKFIDPRSLRLLEICLNRSGVRWPQLDLDMAPGDIPVVQFSQLEELRLECVDTEGLSTSLKKMNFPALQKLSISFLPPAAVGPKSTHLPRHESIFREPRFPNLTHLSLSRFSLDKDNVKMMLRYLQALTHLTLDSCPGAGPVVCSLSGGACANSHVSSTRTWSCPRLQHLRLVRCPDVRFRCLSGMVHSRKVCSSDDAGGSVVLLGKGRQFDVATSRVVKPLKKTAMSHSGSAPSTPYGKGHNSVMSAAGTSASPNGSLLSEWNPYAILKPSCLVTIYIASCPRISEAEAMSLKSTNWGVSDVTYYQ